MRAWILAAGPLSCPCRETCQSQCQANAHSITSDFREFQARRTREIITTSPQASIRGGHQTGP